MGFAAAGEVPLMRPAILTRRRVMIVRPPHLIPASCCCPCCS